MGKKKILIVDDEMHMRIFMATLFETSGYEPVLAKGGGEGIRKAKECMPALIILDVMMPGEGGALMYRQLKMDATLKRIPVIMLSAVAGKTFIHSLKMLSLGREEVLPEPEAYVEKPPKASTLLQIAEKLLAQTADEK
jgi:CheY-like chemotaxis protein